MSSDPNPVDPMSAAIDALDAASRLDPRPSHVGFSSSDFSLSGIGMFHWYPTLDELFRALIHDLPAAFVVDPPEAVAEASVRIEAAAAGFTGPDRTGPACFDALRTALKGIQRLEWLGTFDDLCTSDHEWALALRERFRDGSDAEEEEGGGRPLDRPIAADEQEEFVGFVREYGY